MAHSRRLPTYETLVTWNVDDVADWLFQIGLSAHVEDFTWGGVSGAVLANMTPESLQQTAPSLKNKEKRILLKHIHAVNKHRLFGGKPPKNVSQPPVPQRDYTEAEEGDTDDSWGSDFDEDDHLSPTPAAMNGQSSNNSESDDDYLDPLTEGRAPSNMTTRPNKSFTCDRTVPAVPDDETPPPVPDRKDKGRKGGERKPQPPPVSTHTPDTPVRNQVISPAQRRAPAPLPGDVTPPPPLEPQRKRSEEIRKRSDIRPVPSPPQEEEQGNYEVPEDLSPGHTSAISMESVMLNARQNGGGRRPLPTPDQEDQIDDVYEEPTEQIEDTVYEDPDEHPAARKNQRPLPQKPVSSSCPPVTALRPKQSGNTQLLGKKILSGLDTVVIKNAQSNLRPVITRLNSEESRTTEPKEIKSGGVKEIANLFNNKPSPPPKPVGAKRNPAPYDTTTVAPVNSTASPSNTTTPVPADRIQKKKIFVSNNYSQDPTTPPINVVRRTKYRAPPPPPPQKDTGPQAPEITTPPNPAPRQGRALPPTPPVTTESSPIIEKPFTETFSSDKKNVTNMTGNDRSGGSDRKKIPLPAIPQAEEMEDLHSYDWYFSDLSRDKSQNMIMNEHRDGAFMVRKSSHRDNPYTLCLYYQGRHWNLHIRRRQDQKYALGTPKANEQTFRSVPEIIDCHKKKPIILVGSVGGDALLTRPPARRSID